MENPAWKARYCSPCIAKEHPPSAMPIQYLFNQGLAGRLRVKASGQVVGLFPGLQRISQFTPFSILLFFLFEAAQVVKTRGVQQA